MNEVLRRERKFLITLPVMYELSARLGAVLAADPHDRGGGYPIRSLYFDTLDDADFEEKEAGIELRRKLRLRCYGADADFAMLEMKQKQGELQKKRSLRLTRREAERLSRGDAEPLLRHREPFAAECYCLMNMYAYRPKAMVEYRRKAFIAKENETRVTFDHSIIASESCFDLFSPELLENTALDPYLAVLEVKYNGFLLSYVKDMLKYCNEVESSVSKYCLSRAVGKHYTF